MNSYFENRDVGNLKLGCSTSVRIGNHWCLDWQEYHNNAILKEKGTILLTVLKKHWFLLIFVLLTIGCAEPQRDSSSVLSLPQEGDFINERFKIGDKFPNFTAIDSEGAPYVVDVSKYGDRYTLIIFWRGDPAFYEMNIPRFIKLYERFEQQGFEIISINTDFASQASQATANIVTDSAGDLYNLEARPSVPWTSLYDNPEIGLVNKFKLRMSQSLFLIDSHGTIISSHRNLNSADVRKDAWTGQSRRVHGTDWTLNHLFNNE